MSVRDEQLLRPVWPYALNHLSQQAQGLVGWWPMAHRGGNILYDLSGRCTHGTIVNGVWGGEGLDLRNASSAYVDLGSGLPAIGSAYTVWADVSFFSDINFGMLVTRAAGAGTDWELGSSWFGGLDPYWGQNGSNTVLSSEGATTGRRRQIAATVTANPTRIFLDGRRTGTAASSGIRTATGTLYFGRRSDGNYIDARFFEVRIYDRALSDEEVYSLYDPQTRYELYYPLGRRLWFIPAAAGAQSVLPSAIASLEAFGSHTVSPGAVSVAPSAIDSAEAFGAHTLTSLFTVSPSGIASAESFGTHTLTPGAVTIAPSGIASAEAIGSHTLSVGGVIISPSGIATGEAFGTATLTPGSVIVAPVSIASLEAFGDHLLSSGFVISPESIASGEAFGVHTLAPGAVTIAPAGIAGAEAFGNPTLGLSINPSAIGSAEAFGTAALTQAIVISPSGIASLEAFGTATLAPGTVVIAPTGIASGEAFGTLIITAAGQGFLMIDDRTFTVSWIDDRTFTL